MAIEKVSPEHIVYRMHGREDDVKQMLQEQAPMHVVLFENLDMSSSQFGSCSLLAVGPNHSQKSVEECEGGYLGDIPSERQYPTGWCPAETVLQTLLAREPFPETE